MMRKFSIFNIQCPMSAQQGDILVSVIVFAVSPTMIWSPDENDFAEVPSCALAIVNVPELSAVIRTISAFAPVGFVPAGQIVSFAGHVGTYVKSAANAIDVAPDDRDALSV